MDLRTNSAGHYVLDVADFDKRAPSRGHGVPAYGELSKLGLAVRNSSEVKCQDLSRLKGAKNLSRLKGTYDAKSHRSGKKNARLVLRKLHVNWGHAPASRSKRILPDADGKCRAPAC